MTLRELSQLYWLKQEIESDARRLEELKQKRSGSSQSGTGGPGGGEKAGGRVERLAIAIVDLENEIQEKYMDSVREQIRLERYIADVRDSHLRLIMKQRFIEGLTWREIARRTGGGNTPDSVRMMVRRYLREN